MQTTTVIQATDPKDLKAAIDALIAGGKSIVQVVETARTFYLVIMS